MLPGRSRGSLVLYVGSPPNQPLHLTGAAILVLRGATVLQAAPAGELCRL
jgi:hypothetical protein